MSEDDRLPSAPRIPKIPPARGRAHELSDTAPPTEDPLEIMRELRAALANFGELCVRLDTSLAVHELAILTAEHKVNTAHEIADETRGRVAELEERVTTLEVEAAE